MSNKLLFSYHDINIYEKEKSFFYPGQWLNDVCIFYGLKIFEIEELSSFPYSSFFLYFDPAVVSYINLQMQEEEEYEELSHGLDLEGKVWLFVPINDNSSFDGSSTHWSLLLCNLQNQEAFHLDSSSNFNQQSAKRNLQKLSMLTKRELKLKAIRVPQQLNSFDCGVYVILFAQASTRFILERDGELSKAGDPLPIDWIRGLEDFLLQNVTAERASSYRQQMLSVINSTTKK